ncbi:MAG TPA: MotA/TolQ/ExbB proton channel family protein, partial [Flavisolibacter sp.]
MAEQRPTATTTSVKATSVQPKKSSNLISWLAPILCILAGYLIWRFILGDAHYFNDPDENGGFWPEHKGPKDALHRIYEGGIIVPLLIGMLLMVIAFSIERFLTIGKALGKGSIADFIRRVQFHLANRNVDAALA